ncbi:MAG: hypothetical protein A2Y63_06535 [Candidatus Riflebacteria bacterium RBG_13_59_9]|nr:MAG: hypothetical protein A2Y63_06535 [Candidatus Riflebacteria bacterium RBG_13_59_9]
MVNNVELFSDAKASKALAPRTREELLKRAKVNYEEQPGDLKAVIAYADALFNSHLFEETEKILQEACTIQEDPDILYNLAFVSWINGKEDSAKEFYRKVVKESRGTPLAKSAEYELWKMGEHIKAKWLEK